MKLDPLRQYAQLQKRLLQEKTSLESRLNEIYLVLGHPPVTPFAGETNGPQSKRGRGQNTMSLREAIGKALLQEPLSRKDLVKAVIDLGYVFTTKYPLNSIGAILYARNSPFSNRDGKFFLPDKARAEFILSASQPPKKRTMSPEAKARISEAQKARWARQRNSR
jgi:hypothetical protein